jgi:hypothetical protein
MTLNLIIYRRVDVIVNEMKITKNEIQAITEQSLTEPLTESA